MALRLRLRGPSGGATINVPAGATAANLEALARDALGLGAGALELLGGHPPKPISVTPDGSHLVASWLQGGGVACSLNGAGTAWTCDRFGSEEQLVERARLV